MTQVGDAGGWAQGAAWSQEEWGGAGLLWRGEQAFLMGGDVSEDGLASMRLSGFHPRSRRHSFATTCPGFLLTPPGIRPLVLAPNPAQVTVT